MEVTGTNSAITSGGSNVSVTGTGGGAGASDGNWGVAVLGSAQITAGGSGTVTVIGQGGNAGGTGGSNHGVFASSNAQITSNGGNVALTGTGGGGAGTSNNCGLQIEFSSTVAGTGNATVTLIGTCGAGIGGSHGTRIVSGAAVTAVNGNISITGTATDGTTASQGFSLSNATIAGAKVQTTGSGTITVIADSMDISSSGVTIDAGTHDVTLRQKTFGQLINLGAADSGTTLGLTNAELNRITAGTLKIGDAQSGPITISAVISPANYRTLALARDTTFSATGGFSSDIGPTVTDIENITVTGTLTITAGATLNTAAKGGFTPTTGQTFQIITNDLADAITGNFNGLPEGATINPFLGVAINARITYKGGSGNDVVIVTNTPPNAGPVAVERYPSSSLKIPISQILAQTSDPDPGDTVSLVSVGAPTSGQATAQISGSFVIYKPNAGFTNGDTFTYTVQDNHGAQASNTVTVGIKVDNAPTTNITKMTHQANGSWLLEFSGIPGRTYGLQFTDQLGDPVNHPWQNVGPVTLDAVGAGTYTDSVHTGPTGFWRFIYPAP